MTQSRLAKSAPAVDMWCAGVGAFLLAAALSWRPSIWFDEAATITAANRSPSDLFRLLGNVDAVHGGYYFLMQLWFSVVPINEFSARLPSALAVGAGAAGLVKLGGLVADRRTGWAAAVAFAALPRIAWAGTEARSFALTAALTVWLTIVFVLAAENGGRGRWARYTVMLALTVTIFVYSAMLVPAYFLALAARRQNHNAWTGFVAATAAGMALAAPVMLCAYRQRGQVGWIADRPIEDLSTVLLWPWFMGKPGIAIAIVALLILVAGLSILVRTSAARPISGTWLAVAWCTFPPAILAGYCIGIENMYQARYLTMTTPGVALLLGICVSALARNRNWVTAALLAALVAAAAPAYAAERGPYPKPAGADFSPTAKVIADHANPGDCVIFDLYVWWSPGSLRLVADAAPSSFAGLIDLTAGTTGVQSAQLWTTDLPWNSPVVTGRFHQCHVVWAVMNQPGTRPDGVDPTVTPESVANGHGFVSERRWELNRITVLRMRRN